ncbi:MAG: helix-turn-helix transcriptional regulator [Ignavibacteriales bacterium]|nr:helix-turn-helix transcriptional regulator [Ignavibacteriales bacterium]
MISEHQILNIYAENVRYFRKKLKISQEELAFRSGLHSSFIGMVERAERNSTLVSLQKIAKALEVGYDDLLNERKMENQ